MKRICGFDQYYELSIERSGISVIIIGVKFKANCQYSVEVAFVESESMFLV